MRRALDWLLIALGLLIPAGLIAAFLYQPKNPPPCWTEQKVRSYEERLGGQEITFTQLEITDVGRCRFKIIMTYTAPWSPSPIHDELTVDFIEGYSPRPRQQLVPIPPPEPPPR